MLANILIDLSETDVLLCLADLLSDVVSEALK